MSASGVLASDQFMVNMTAEGMRRLVQQLDRFAQLEAAW